MSVSATGSDEGYNNELGVYDKWGHWSGSACLFDICAAQT